MKYNSIIQFQPFSYSVFLSINLFVYSYVVLHDQLYTDNAIGRLMPVGRGSGVRCYQKAQAQL